MKILQISSARSIGGGERHVVDLSNQLARRGHDVFAAVAPGSPLIAELNSVATANISEIRLRNALDLPSASQIAKFARENDVELINAHLARDYTLAAIASRSSGIPFVITRHVLFPMSRAHRFFLRGVKYVIAPSNAVAASLQRHGIFPTEKIVTIRYGLDVSTISYAPHADRENLVVGSVGNLDPVKGFDVLIEAAAMVAGELPGIRFEIAGEDRSRDGRNRRELEQMISEHALEKVVTLGGWSDDIAGRLAEMDIFVSASRSESFGFVIAEAMLAGVPAIASETEGAREIIGDPGLGRLVPIGEPEPLAAAILDLARDGELRQRLTVGGADHIRKYFSLGRMVDDTEALYERAIRGV